MSEVIDVLIGIQARSNSTRFPGKIYEYVSDRRVLEMVVDAAKKGADYIHKYSKKDRYIINCMVAVLHPNGDDKLTETYKNINCYLIGGPEHDVLSRYMVAKKLTGAHYVVRITSDCPLISDTIITKHINTIIRQREDYINNIDEDCRFFPDGMDCEVMSARAMDWLNDNAKTPEEREHVTIAIRQKWPNILNKGFVIGKVGFDNSSDKLSVDTIEDLERIRVRVEAYKGKLSIANAKYGKTHVYEL